MTTQYMFSDSERQEQAINTIYDVLAEYTARESKTFNFSFSAGAFLHWLVVFVMLLVMVNLALVSYVALSWL